MFSLRHRLFAFCLAIAGNLLLLQAMTWLHRRTPPVHRVQRKKIPPAFAKVRRPPPPREEDTSQTPRQPSMASATSLMPALKLPSAIPLPNTPSVSLQQDDGLLHPGNGTGGGKAQTGGGGGMLILTEEMVDRSPRILVRIPPNYPAHAETSNLEGEVRMRLLVGLDGRVERVEVLQSRPVQVFDEAAKAAVLQWRFESARFRGRPVRVWVQQRITFRLR